MSTFWQKIPILLLLFLFLAPWFSIEIAGPWRRRKLPIISDDEFYNELKQHYDIPQDYAINARKRIAKIIRFPLPKLHSGYSLEMIGKHSGTGFQVCDYDFTLIEEADYKGVTLPPWEKLNTISDMVYFLWIIDNPK